MPARPSVRAVGALATGLLLGLAGGAVLGLLRPPRPTAAAKAAA